MNDSLTSNKPPSHKFRPRAVSNPIPPEGHMKLGNQNLLSETQGVLTSTLSGLADSRSIAAPQPNCGPNNQAISYDLVQQKTEASVNKIGKYFRSELLMAGEDLLLLEKLNRLTKEQFEEMSSTAQDLLAGGSKMQQAFSDFEPLLNQIDEISLQIDYLELVANELDEYSSELEEKVKTIKKRKDFQKKAPGTQANAPSLPSGGKR